MVAIGGETTVDYSLRLKRELGGGSRAIWVAGYSNDIFGYLGSKRVIMEGGYEGQSSGLTRFPGPWAISTEDRVIEKVYEMIAAVNH
jgi:neutral ceramidase